MRRIKSTSVKPRPSNNSEYKIVENKFMLSIIVVNYNTWHYLNPCIYSIMNNFNDVTYEIIVVDNASSDGSVPNIKKEFRDIKLIENKKNIGFARANNQAIKISRGKYIFLLNADTLIKNDRIKKMLDYMDQDESIGITGPIQLDINENIVTSYSFDKTFKNHKTSILLDALYFNKFLRVKMMTTSKPFTVGYINGAAIILKREVIQKIGLLDERFFFMAEEVDYAFRCNAAGYQIKYYQDFKVLHYGASGQGLTLWGLMQYHYSNFKLFEKYGSTRAVASLYFVIWLITRSIYSFCSIFILRASKLNVERLKIYLKCLIWYLTLGMVKFSIKYQ